MLGLSRHLAARLITGSRNGDPILAGDVGAASSANLWGAAWLTWSIVVLLAVIVAMYAVGASYYYPLRALVGGKDGAAPADGEALARALDSRRPEILLAVGGGGLLILIWLMVLKPA